MLTQEEKPGVTNQQSARDPQIPAYHEDGQAGDPLRLIDRCLRDLPWWLLLKW